MSFSVSSTHATFSRALLWALLVLFALLATLMPHFALAATAATDPFSSGKAQITKAIDDSSTIHYGIMAGATIVAVLTGVFQKNWPLGIAIFVIANIFYSLAIDWIA
ncbi:type IV conjugative transfer system pilin TraA [Vibrio mediterranei]|uniref:type IV conjugative transfer system pilin TraA n=1 Tax=Vibrio mediterranei TaxID=689 RepID=UPI002283662F|nr:type IV conjugative transfer system pilin TraA [Vibrio mediterranei]MCY9855383.1 hypothetical protein [Vibrio mediterranei]